MKFKLESRTIEVKENCVQLELDYAVIPDHKVIVFQYNKMVDVKLEHFKWSSWVFWEMANDEYVAENKLIIRYIKEDGQINKREINLNLPKEKAEELLELIQMARKRYSVNSNHGL
ncbi:MAG: hypothetical protein J7604_24570 [Sporocytophaga sp.]|uniref:hypothetical protein n=1 Tax=Sporocytophaga sp. TaxID=2231183 RepID=UPI001B169B94|nr:hypothetical protein [Sporocytophaga sp.]MBO9703406.1 hypothetical protein [Sporocytophaga sp.]